jgi:hypothetical protein
MTTADFTEAPAFGKKAVKVGSTTLRTIFTDMLPRPANRKVSLYDTSNSCEFTVPGGRPGQMWKTA